MLANRKFENNSITKSKSQRLKITSVTLIVRKRPRTRSYTTSLSNWWHGPQSACGPIEGLLRSSTMFFFHKKPKTWIQIYQSPLQSVSQIWASWIFRWWFGQQQFTLQAKKNLIKIWRIKFQIIFLSEPLIFF